MARSILLWINRLFARPQQHQELKHFSLFRELDAHELSLVHACLHRREFAAGESVFEESFPLEVIYFIEEGEIQVTGLTAGSAPVVLKKHQFLGIIDLFGKSQRLSSARALTDAKLLALPQNDFWELVSRDKALGVKLLAACCRFLSRYIQDLAHTR